MAWGGSGGNVRLSHLLISFLYLNACTGKGQYQSAQCSLQTHLLGGRVRPHVVSVQSFLFLFKVSFSSFCGGFRLPYRTMWHWLRPPLYRHSTHDQPTINQPTTSVTRGVAISSSMNSNAKITIVRNCFSIAVANPRERERAAALLYWGLEIFPTQFSSYPSWRCRDSTWGRRDVRCRWRSLSSDSCALSRLASATREL